MNIDYELKLNNDIKIGWKSNKKDVLRICKENNIDYISKTYGSIFEISLPIEFANLGKVIANIYFVNDLIKKVSISSTDKKDFNILDYQITDEKLKKYFGPPKKAKNNNTIWKFNKIKVRHYFLDIDGYPIEYLTLENSF